jgi:arylsulfatase A-like enzyme/Tfp pilus assembly protein PilF
MSVRPVAVALAGILSSGPACGRAAAPTHGNERLAAGSLSGSNVLLVTIDTLRADRVGAYSGVPLTPTLDRLASSGVRFTDAHAHVPMTLPAHTSIMTGLVPPTHGVHTNGSTIVAAATPTLASAFQGAGYRTGAFVAAFVLDARFGLSRGFQTYDDRVGSDTGPITFAYAERPADRVTQLAGDWILGSQSRLGDEEGAPRRPWFCWVHLFDPHAPYHAPEQRFADAYDNEVAFADAQLGRLLDRLRAARQLDSTLIVVLADHGEALGDHGEATHGLFAYEATLRIPLIIASPAIQPAVSDAAAAQADVLPTILELVGIPVPAPVDGLSLLPAIRGEKWLARPIYFEALDANVSRNWAPLTGVISDHWKYIDLPDAELYDLGADPGEQRNRMRDDRARAAALSRRLGEIRAPVSASAREQTAPIDADAAARLRSLGYSAGAAPHAAARQYAAADDPKRLLDLDRRFEAAMSLTGARSYERAATMLQRVIAERPDFTAAYLNLASVFIASREPRRAVTLLEDATHHGIAGPEVLARLGVAYLEAGDLNRAATVLDSIADPAQPGGLEAANTLATVLAQQGRPDRARRLFEAVLAQSPHAATTWSNLGLLELSTKRPHEAARAFEQAADADPTLEQAWEGLAAARAPFDPAGAIDALKHAIDLAPHNYDVMFNLAVQLREHARSAEARPYLERFVREAPPQRYTRDIALFRRWLSER